MGFLGFRSAVADIRELQSCIIVCGLHRSGTSAVTRLINLLGADISRDLAPPRSDNIRGYWESFAILAAHDRLLQAVAASPNHSFDPTPLPVDWLATNAAREAKRRLTNIIQREFADSRFFVVKDPRMWRVLPLWIELLEDLGISPIVVIPFRNPLEVAASLAQRDSYSQPKALLLYFSAYLETELASRAIPRVFVRYDHLIKDWHPFARSLGQIPTAGIALPSADIASEIERFLTTDLYHHRFSREQMVRQSEIPSSVVEMFDRMDEAATTGDESKLRSSFDQLRVIADTITRLYHGYAITELQFLRQQVMHVRESFEASRSWRITAPLRWMKVRVLSKVTSSP
jgi:hypothetical protein